jgi:hypothetical protein
MAAETGARWEAAVVAWLKSRGHRDVFRLRGQEGPRDHGDVGGFSRWALDCKDHAKHTLSAWVAQVKQEAVNAEKPLAAVIVKRRGAKPEDAYVVMDLATWERLESYLSALSDEVRGQ